MKANNFILKANTGKNTTLDKEYTRLILGLKGNINENEEEEERWEIYNAIIEKLIEDGKINEFNELKYRLTDNETPSTVMLDIVKKYKPSDKNYNGLVPILMKKVEEYVDEDFYKRFYE